MEMLSIISVYRQYKIYNVYKNYSDTEGINILEISSMYR